MIKCSGASEGRWRVDHQSKTLNGLILPSAIKSGERPQNYFTTIYIGFQWGCLWFLHFRLLNAPSQSTRLGFVLNMKFYPRQSRSLQRRIHYNEWFSYEYNHFWQRLNEELGNRVFSERPERIVYFTAQTESLWLWDEMRLENLAMDIVNVWPLPSKRFWRQQIPSIVLSSHPFHSNLIER